MNETQSEKKILFVNACLRPDSRTLRLAGHLLSHLEGQICEVDLRREQPAPLTWETLQRRDELQRTQSWDDPMFRYARQLTDADELVIAAPYWDLNFPAVLKAYLEQLAVTGLTFSYGEDGRPVSHCRLQRLFYVMTSGGPILPPVNHAYDYVKTLVETFFGVRESTLFYAELLDVVGMDVEALLCQAEKEIDDRFTRP